MRIRLFTTCLGDIFAQEAVLSTARILRRLGHEVTLPEQTCCGQPAYNSGFQNEARPFIGDFLNGFAGSDAVVAPSGSCVAMLRRGLLEFFGDDARARELEPRVFELSQFLLDVQGLKAPPGHFEARVIYHESCHLSHWLHEGDRARELLAGIAGLEVRTFREPQLCCGFGGTFAIHFPDLSLAMADEKLRDLGDPPPDYIVGSDEGCLMQLGGRLAAQGVRRPETLHLNVLLDRAGVGK